MNITKDQGKVSMPVLAALMQDLLNPRAYPHRAEGCKLNAPHISKEEKTRVLAVTRRYFELAESYTQGAFNPYPER